jgi:hypothetical protein
MRGLRVRLPRLALTVQYAEAKVNKNLAVGPIREDGRALSSSCLVRRFTKQPPFYLPIVLTPSIF